MSGTIDVIITCCGGAGLLSNIITCQHYIQINAVVGTLWLSLFLCSVKSAVCKLVLWSPVYCKSFFALSLPPPV